MPKSFEIVSRIFNNPILLFPIVFNYFSSQKFAFEFNKKTFEIYNKDLVPDLLGKRGNQTAINVAGSAWKKIIRRYKTKKQEPSVTLNRKYVELLNLIKDHVSSKIDDPSKFDSFAGLQKTMVENLIRFKNDTNFRVKVAPKICDKKLELKKGIPLEYTYIVFCIYVASKYSYFDRNEKAKFAPIKFNSQRDYLQKYYEALMDSSFKVVNNLTCFCHRQYFWLDYRLSNSNRSAIHSIISRIFSELNILPTSEIDYDDIEKEAPKEALEVIEEDKGYIYPKAKAVHADFIELEIATKEITKVSKKRKRKTRPKVIDFEKEHRKNKRLGDQGEEVVYHKEKEHLKEEGLNKLAKKVKWVSKIDDRAGYDILSFELDGAEKFIEVKSTNAKPQNAYFHMSANQYDKAKKIKNYYLYIVFEAKTETPKIWRIKNPFRYEDKGLTIIPSNYKMVINTKP